MPASPVIRILVVDDFPLVGATIAALLRTEGFEHVDVARGGRQAIEKMQASAYDLVVSDFKMPDIDGRQLFEATRELKFERTRFLIVSAHVAPQDIATIKKWGVDGVLLKPFRSAALKQAIDEIFTDAAVPA